MKAVLFAVLIASLAVGGCVSSSGPENPLRSLKTRSVAPKPDAAMAARSGERIDRIGTGYWVFQRKCMECHESRVPRDPDDPNWHPTLVGMSWNAGLSEEEQGAVMAYLRAATR